MDYKELNDKLKQLKIEEYMAYIYWNNIYKLVCKYFRKKIFYI